MTRVCPSLFVLFVLLAGPCLAAAQGQPQNPPTTTTPGPAAEPDYPIVRVGMLSYLQYAAELGTATP